MQAFLTSLFFCWSALLFVSCSGGDGAGVSNGNEVPVVGADNETGRLAIRVNGIRIFSQSRPTVITQYNNAGAVVRMSDIIFDQINGTETTTLQTSTGGVLSFASRTIRRFDAEGRTVSNETESGDELVAITQTYAGQQISTLQFTGSSAEVVVRYDIDRSGRAVQAQLFSLPDETLRWSSVRTYREGGWENTFTAFDPTGGELVSTKTVRMNPTGQVVEVLNRFADNPNVAPSKRTYTYDSAGRLTEMLVFDDASSDAPISRTEFTGYVDVGEGYHDVVQSEAAYDFVQF